MFGQCGSMLWDRWQCSITLCSPKNFLKKKEKIFTKMKDRVVDPWLVDFEEIWKCFVIVRKYISRLFFIVFLSSIQPSSENISKHHVFKNSKVSIFWCISRHTNKILQIRSVNVYEFICGCSQYIQILSKLKLHS
jgi:hypothetical protein